MVVALQRVEPVAVVEDDLASAARRDLGYRVVNSLVLTNSVVAALKSAGVRPFDSEQVRKYKEEMVFKTNFWSVVVLSIIALVAFVIPPVAATMIGDPQVLIFWFVSLLVAFAEVGVWAGLVKCWDYVRLEGYRGQVPKYVVETALAVKEGMRKTDHEYRFEVDLLGTSGQIKACTAICDPFLVLNVDGYRLWLDTSVRTEHP